MGGLQSTLYLFTTGKGFSILRIIFPEFLIQKKAHVNMLEKVSEPDGFINIRISRMKTKASGTKNSQWVGACVSIGATIQPSLCGSQQFFLKNGFSIIFLPVIWKHTCFYNWCTDTILVFKALCTDTFEATGSINTVFVFSHTHFFRQGTFIHICKE